MSFRVIWKHSCIQTLTEIYVHALEQGQGADEITQAAADIDALLQQDPALRGESRENEERIFFVGPFSVIFEIHDEEQVVFVLAIYLRRTR